MTTDDAMRPPRTIGVVGVPTSAGSHNAGQDKAPAALRAAGLISRLVEAGVDVRDFGDLPSERHRPSPKVNGVRDLDRVADIARRTRDEVARIRALGCRPLVLGGDCTITLGVVAGLSQRADVGLLYFDGDADLNVPQTSQSGVLDTMGMTHLLGGGEPALSRLGPRGVLLRPDQVSLVGFDPGELDTDQWERLVAYRLDATPASSVRVDPVGQAAAAFARLRDRVDEVVVHFDIDVIDTGAFPLANFPHFAGLSLDQASACMDAFCGGAGFAGLVVTEANPDHDPDGTLVAALVDTIVHALAPSG